VVETGGDEQDRISRSEPFVPDAQQPATHRPEGSPAVLPAPTGTSTHHHARCEYRTQPRRSSRCGCLSTGS
jgi:hypothetical protein